MITQKDVGKIVELKGIVVSIRKPYIRITSSIYECPSCGCIITIIQEEKKLREPKKCSCGRRTGFRMVEHEETEGQDIYVLEQGSDFGYVVYLEKEKLIRILTKIQEGCAVRVKGLVKVEFRSGSAVGDLVIFANELEQIKKSYSKGE